MKREERRASASAPLSGKEVEIKAGDYPQESLIYTVEVQMVSKGKYLFFTKVNYYSLCQDEVCKIVKGNI